MRVATLVQQSDGSYLMTSYDDRGFSYTGQAAPASSTTCAAPTIGGLPSLAVDVIDNGLLPPDSQYRRSGATLCASAVGPFVIYKTQRSDLTGPEGADEFRDDHNI